MVQMNYLQGRNGEQTRGDGEGEGREGQGGPLIFSQARLGLHLSHLLPHS